MAERTFPIQGFAPGVPWAAAEQAYETYAKHFGNEQSLKRLAERGGFGLYEFACLYLGTVTFRKDMMEDRIGQALGKALAAPTTGGTDELETAT